MPLAVGSRGPITAFPCDPRQPRYDESPKASWLGLDHSDRTHYGVACISLS